MIDGPTKDRGERTNKTFATIRGRSTIRAGIREFAGRDADRAVPRALRRPGGGRKRLAEPGLLAAVEKLVDPATRGDPMCPLRWKSKSMVKLATTLRAQGYEAGPDSVASLLKEMNYSLTSRWQR